MHDGLSLNLTVFPPPPPPPQGSAQLSARTGTSEKGTGVSNKGTGASNKGTGASNEGTGASNEGTGTSQEGSTCDTDSKTRGEGNCIPVALTGGKQYSTVAFKFSTCCNGSLQLFFP